MQLFFFTVCLKEAGNSALIRL